MGEIDRKRVAAVKSLEALGYRFDVCPTSSGHASLRLERKRGNGEPVSRTVPTFVEPCIPTAAKSLPTAPGWLHEPKLDGWRIQVVKAWQPPIENAAWPEADRLHGLLIQRADHLAGCTENSPEEAELEAIADALDAYELRRWPRGKVEGGKG